MQAMAGVEHHEVYPVPLLNAYDSRCLFNRNAFLSESPSADFVDLAVKVADACGGHALSLETIGASLFDKKDPGDKEIWFQAVMALRINGDIFGKLRSTYDNLPSDYERAMFQDIACMFIGMEKDLVMTIWESCSRCTCSTSRIPTISLRRLVDRSLVEIDGAGRLRMHDVLRDMGRDIVVKEALRIEERAHLWNAIDALKALSYEQINTKVRGICLAISKDMPNESNVEQLSMRGGGPFCDISKLASMKELHLLILDGCDFNEQGDFSSWPQELRWLKWRSFCYKRLPSEMKLPSLVVLDLCRSRLTYLWGIDAHIKLPLLQVLILTSSWLVELPTNIGQSLPKLKKLLLNNCQNLQRLPGSIGYLTDLEYLDLTGCFSKQFVTLPPGMVGLLSLKTLILSRCEGLQWLPEELGNITKLETLDLSYCYSFSKLPTSMGGLKMLKRLNLTSTKIKYLPMDFGHLTSLTILSISSFLDSSSGLCTFPNTFKGLQALSSLHIEDTLVDLDYLGGLTTLREFHLRDHETITTMPKSFGNLKCLIYLKIMGCSKLLTIEALPEGLEHLELNCANLTTIPSFTRMKSLLHLDLSHCQSLEHVHGLECLTMLEVVAFTGCFRVANQGVCLMGNKALQACHLSGSKIGVAYNCRWLEGDHVMEVISCLGNAIPLLTNGMSDEIVVPHLKWTLVVEASISSKAECVAFIVCFVVQIPMAFVMKVGMKFQIVRHGRLVVESGLEFHNVALHNFCASKYICWFTLRRNHEVVQALQQGDQICVLVVNYGGELTVLKGTCVVHHENGHFTFENNSDVLSNCKSEELARQFDKLVLKDIDDD